jgi:hypothetical protein
VKKVLVQVLSVAQKLGKSFGQGFALPKATEKLG